MQKNRSHPRRSNYFMVQSHQILNSSYFQNPIQMSQQWPTGQQHNNENQFPQSQQSPQKDMSLHKLPSDKQFTNCSLSSMANVQVVRKIFPSDSNLDQSVIKSKRSVSNYKPAFVNYPHPMFAYHPPVRQLEFGNSEIKKRCILEMNWITELLKQYQGENAKLKIEKQQYIDLQSQKDKLIVKLEKQILELLEHLEEEEEGEIEPKITQFNTFEEEAKVWKEKFMELNDKFYGFQEKLQNRDAEYIQLIKSQSSQKIIEQGSKIRKNDPNFQKKSLGTNKIQKR